MQSNRKINGNLMMVNEFTTSASTSAYFLSNNGMGDNIISIGAIRFLLQYYTTVYFLCKTKYHAQIQSILSYEPRIVLVTFNEHMENTECIDIINKAYATNDVFVSGLHKKHLQSKITNLGVLQYVQDHTAYNLNHDTINDTNFAFIRGFYTDIGLDLRVFYEYFHMESNDMSRKLYDTVKHYKRIIFTQTTASNNASLNIDGLKEKYMNDDETIMLCNNYNMYDASDSRHKISQHFVMNNMSYYIDTILNCNEIYIIDSCFVAIILPLLKTNRLKATIVRIILRQLVNEIKLI